MTMFADETKEAPVPDGLGPWFHNIHLPGGIQTAPDHRFGDFPRWKWEQFAHLLPADLRGWSVLDIGCNAGFYSFELARRRASVLAMDHDERYLRQARWAARKLGLQDRIEFQLRSSYDLVELDRDIDLVLFLGVFYHLRYPLLVLDAIAQLRPRLMVFQSLTMGSREMAESAPLAFDFDERDRMNDSGWPSMAFIEGTFANDPTNWWAPNRACVHSLLRSAGFRVTAEPGHELFLCEYVGQNERPPLWEEEWKQAVRLRP